MDKDRQRALTDNQQKLRTRILVVNILPPLRPYFTEIEYQNVKEKAGNRDQVDELLEILLTKENWHFDGFCRVLEHNGYRHWAKQLREEAGVRKEEADSEGKVTRVK